MRHYTNSDIFQYINRGNNFQSDVANTVRAINPSIIINDMIKSSIADLTKTSKEGVLVKVIDAINKHDLLLINPPIEVRLPEYAPFIKAKFKGKVCVIIDVSRYTSPILNSKDELAGYKVDINKLYNLIIPAYIALKFYVPNSLLPAETAKGLAKVWARMFCNVLMSNAIGILQNHSERLEAFMYFAFKFFLIYYLEEPANLVDKLAESTLEDGKSQYILIIEDKCKSLGINMYEDFGTLCRTLFNNDITNIKGAIAKVNDMNQSELINAYIRQYGTNAIMSLCAVEYFTWTIFAAYNKCNIMKDRGLENVLYGRRGEYKREVPKLFDSIYKEL